MLQVVFYIRLRCCIVRLGLWVLNLEPWTLNLILRVDLRHLVT